MISIHESNDLQRKVTQKSSFNFQRTLAVKRCKHFQNKEDKVFILPDKIT